MKVKTKAHLSFKHYEIVELEDLLARQLSSQQRGAVEQAEEIASKAGAAVIRLTVLLVEKKVLTLHDAMDLFDIYNIVEEA